MKITNEKYQNLNLANEENRGDNLIIDFIISSIFGLTFAYLTFKNFTLAFLIYLFVRFIYYFSFESLFGKTPGKYLTQTKVVNRIGEKPTYNQLIKRNLTRFISVISGISDDERALHDILSNTFVVKHYELKKIEIKKNKIKQPLLLILNQSLVVYWIYIFGTKTELKTLDKIILVTLVLTFIFGLIFGIRKIKINR